MCMLRATNPMKVRPTRRTIRRRLRPTVCGEPTIDELAGRLAGYVVLAHDPAVPAVAADYWQHSAPFYRTVPAAGRVRGRVRSRGPTGIPAPGREPTDTVAERAVQVALAGLLAADPGVAARARAR